jgi:hypothetical protein
MLMASTSRSPVTGGLSAGLFSTIVLVAVFLQTGCTAPIARPAGVPDTPYWFVAADSTYWYLAAESLAVVQLAQKTAADVAEQKLYELRRLGWRMTPGRGPALQRAGQEQELSQFLFQVERVDGAVSPTTDRDAFVRRFWRGRRMDQSVKGILPGLLPGGRAPVRYFYPSCLSVTWRDNITASEATVWLQQRGCRVLSSPQMVFQFFVQRVWVVELPAGAELFTNLRELNSDPRVETAFPVISLSEPPAPDPRNPGRNLLTAEPGGGGDSGLPAKWSVPLWRGYRIAHFAEYAGVARELGLVPVEGERFGVILAVDPAPGSEDSLLVARYRGTVVAVESGRVEAWIPFDALPDLAAEPRVRRLDAAQR